MGRMNNSLVIVSIFGQKKVITCNKLFISGSSTVMRIISHSFIEGMNLQDLPVKLVYKIFSNLSYRERMSLRLCSKDVRSAAIDAPLLFTDNVVFEEVDDSFDESARQIAIQLRFEGINLKFGKSETVPNSTYMKVTVDNKTTTEKNFEDTNFYEVARSYLRNIVIKDNVICNCFDTNYQITEGFLKDLDKLKTKRFRSLKSVILDSNSSNPYVNIVSLWLNHMNPEYLKSVTVYMDDVKCIVSDSGDNISHVDTLHILQRSDINDDVLGRLIALDIELEPAEITTRGINQIVKKWINQKVPCGSRFVYYVDDSHNFPLDEIIKNIQIPAYLSSTKAIFPLSTDRCLQVWLDDSSVNVECIKKK